MVFLFGLITNISDKKFGSVSVWMYGEIRMNNKVIWKYKLESLVSQTIRMPQGAKILTVQIQNEVPCIWVEVDICQKTKKENRYILIHPTGREINLTRQIYIGTFQLDQLVLHVFEMEEEE